MEDYAYTRWIVVVPVYREDRYGDVDIGIFVVDMVECSISFSSWRMLFMAFNILPSKSLAPITQHLQLARLLSVAVHAQASHHLVHRFTRRLVLVEEIAGEQDHIDIAFLGQTHNLVKRLPAVIATDRISFVVADMVVCCHEDADRVCCGEVGHDGGWRKDVGKRS